MKSGIVLLTLWFFLSSAMLGAQFITPVSASDVAITGIVTYNWKPLTEYTTFTVPRFWVRNEDTGNAALITASYNSSTAEYVITVPGAGKYGIGVFVDAAEPFRGGLGFAGDFYGWFSPVTVLENQSSVKRDLPLLKILHLTSPKDNRREIGYIVDPYNRSYDCYYHDIVFAWDAVLEATKYEVRIHLHQSDPYAYFETVHHNYTTDTDIRPVLPLSEENQHYELNVYAYNGTDRVGLLMVSYYDGYGWDYRFRLVADKIAPTADAGSDQTLTAGFSTASFDARGSSDNVGIVSYEWDFGDETTGAGETAIHTYREAGTYTVKLTVKDAAGHSDTDVMTVTVHTVFPLWTIDPYGTWTVGVGAAVCIAAGIVMTAKKVINKNQFVMMIAIIGLSVLYSILGRETGTAVLVSGAIMVALGYFIFRMLREEIPLDDRIILTTMMSFFMILASFPLLLMLRLLDFDSLFWIFLGGAFIMFFIVFRVARLSKEEK